MSRAEGEAGLFITLFHKEILENLTGRRFLLVFLLCLIIVPLGVYVSTRDYLSSQQAWQESVHVYEVSHKSPNDILFLGAKAYRPPSALSFLSLGLEIVMPNVAETPAKTDPYSSSVELRFDNDQPPDNIYEFFHGPLDLVFIVAVMMTFVAISFSYGCVSAEREQGTLKQILSNAVPRNKVILAKAVANYVTVIFPFLFSVLLSLTIFHQNVVTLFDADGGWLHVALAIVFSLLLIGAFFNLGLLVSTLTRQAVSSIVFLLLCWVLLFGIVPRLGIFLAQAIYPIKSPAVLASEKEKIFSANEKECEAGIDNLLDSGRGTIDNQKAVRDEYAKKLQQDMRQLDQDWARTRDIQIAAATNIARLSPVSCFVRPMAEISKSGWLIWRRFMADVTRFQTTLNEKIYGQNSLEVTRSGINVHEQEISGPAPAFQTTEVSIKSLFGDILPDLILLVLYNLLFFAGAFVSFLRYDAR